MIAAGELGELRVVHAAYIQDWLTNPIDAEGQKQAEWRTDPARAGASACLADIGVHAHNLALFVTGLELDAVSADLTTFVPGRRLDDNAHVLLRFANGARGALLASQVAVGNLNNLSVKVYGSQGRASNGSARSRSFCASRPMASPCGCCGAADPASRALAAEASRMPAGHPEGYIEGFANLYLGAAELVARAPAGTRAAALRRADARRARRRARARLHRSCGRIEPQRRRLDFGPALRNLAQGREACRVGVVSVYRDRRRDHPVACRGLCALDRVEGGAA